MIPAGGIKKGSGAKDMGGFLKMADDFNKQMTMKAAIEDYAAELQEQEQMAIEARREQELAAKKEEESDEFDFSDDDEFTNQFMEERMAQMQAQNTEINDWKRKGHGALNHIVESEFLDTVLKSQYSVVHFYHKEFHRCDIVDMHLEKLAKKYLGTKFAKIDAQKTPFFVEKLQVQVIPCVCMLENGKMCGRLDGFDLLGGEDDFPTEVMECVIGASGVIAFKPPEDECGHFHSIFDKQRSDIVGLNKATSADSDDDE